MLQLAGRAKKIQAKADAENPLGFASGFSFFTPAWHVITVYLVSHENEE
jgi:hypothetical protein